jgi:hypothetical protein
MALDEVMAVILVIVIARLIIGLWWMSSPTSVL